MQAGILDCDEIHHDAMQKLTLTIVHREDGERRFVLSNFNPLNEAVLGGYGLFSEAPAVIGLP